MPFLKPQVQGLFKFCVTVQCHEKELVSISVAQTLHTLGEKNPSKIRFLDF